MAKKYDNILYKVMHPMVLNLVEAEIYKRQFELIHTMVYEELVKIMGHFDHESFVFFDANENYLNGEVGEECFIQQEIPIHVAHAHFIQTGAVIISDSKLRENNINPLKFKEYLNSCKIDYHLAIAMKCESDEEFSKAYERCRATLNLTQLFNGIAKGSEDCCASNHVDLNSLLTDVYLLNTIYKYLELTESEDSTERNILISFIFSLFSRYELSMSTELNSVSKSFFEIEGNPFDLVGYKQFTILCLDANEPKENISNVLGYFLINHIRNSITSRENDDFEMIESRIQKLSSIGDLVNLIFSEKIKGHSLNNYKSLLSQLQAMMVYDLGGDLDQSFRIIEKTLKNRITLLHTTIFMPKDIKNELRTIFDSFKATLKQQKVVYKSLKCEIKLFDKLMTYTVNRDNFDNLYTSFKTKHVSPF